MMKPSAWWALPALFLSPVVASAQTVTADGPTTPVATVRPPAPPPTLPAVLTPVAGGMTAEQAAERAIRASAQVRAAHATTEAADAAHTEAGYAMIPGLTLQARYTRLSELTLNNPFASLTQLGQLTSRLCANTQNGVLSATATPGMCPTGTVALVPSSPSSSGSSNSSSNPFQPLYNQYAFRATLTIPVTDIPFRLARLYEAAGRTREARQFDEEATRAQAAADGRVAFYEYMRAQGQASVAEQAVEGVRRHREDLARFVEAGTVARVELMRVEAQLAETERMLVLAREGLGVAEANLRIRLLLQPGEHVTLGEALDAPPDNLPGSVQPLIDQAWRSRPELVSIERQVSALDANLSAVRAGYFPSLVAQGNVDIADPNTRVTPQQDVFTTTWDASLILQWSPTGALQTSATASRVIAQREAVRAQTGALLAGIELDVRGAWTNVQGARAAIEAAARQMAAAEESYRVRRERFLAGNAISSDLTDAENDLLRARFAVVNANVDLRVALARLRRAIGTPEARR